MKRALLGIIVVSCLVIYAAASVLTDDTAGTPEEEDSQHVSAKVEEGIKEGDLAPDFTLQTLSGEEVKLSDYRGKPVFLNFWATWCPPCKAEMPHMQEFYEENQSQAEVLAVNLTSNESSINTVEKFAEQYNITFPILLDINGEQAEKFATITIPTTYIIDKNGIIKQRKVGPMSKEGMKELVSSLQ